MTSTSTPAATAARPALTPDFPDEQTAARDGWRAISTFCYLPVDRAVAESILATLSGTAPGSRAVRFCIIGDRHRVAFARLASELVGERPAASPAPAPPVALDDGGAEAA